MSGIVRGLQGVEGAGRVSREPGAFRGCHGLRVKGGGRWRVSRG